MTIVALAASPCLQRRHAKELLGSPAARGLSRAAVPDMVVVASSFVGGGRARWAADSGVGACWSASKNKGGLALLFFEHQGIDLPPRCGHRRVPVFLSEITAVWRRALLDI